jgi:hypothetical protein
MEIDITVTDLGFSTVRGFFLARCNVRFKLDFLDDSTIINSALLESGKLTLLIDNNIGIEADVFFQINEFYKNAVSLDTTLRNQFWNIGGADRFKWF